MMLMRCLYTNSMLALFFFVLFNCYLAAPQPTLDHYQGDSFTHSPDVYRCVLHFRHEGHREPCNEVGSLSPAECLVGFKPGTFRLPNSMRVLVLIISMYPFCCSLMCWSLGVMGSQIVSSKYSVSVLMEPIRSILGCWDKAWSPLCHFPVFYTIWNDHSKLLSFMLWRHGFGILLRSWSLKILKSGLWSTETLRLVHPLCKHSGMLKWQQQDSNQNDIVPNWTLNHLAKLIKWLRCVVSTHLCGAFDCMQQHLMHIWHDIQSNTSCR